MGAVEFGLAPAKVVHHVLFAYDASGSVAKMDGVDGKPGFTGMSAIGITVAQASGSLGGWAVGALRCFCPTVWRCRPKGPDVVLQMHFHLPTASRKVHGRDLLADKAPERR